MKKLHFEAILAKNQIARELRNARIYKEEPNLQFIAEMLKDIEKYIGEGNQPSVTDIINDDKEWL